jgi:predicted nucleic acid-binding Zn ribbon protein
VLQFAHSTPVLQTEIAMKRTKEEFLRWQRTRERFRIADPFPPAKKRSEKPIGEILASMREQSDPGPDPAPAVLIERWPLITGPMVAKHTRPVHIRGQILSVYVDHPGWLTEVRRLSKKHLLKKIESVPDLGGIRDIRFMLDPDLRTFRRSR